MLGKQPMATAHSHSLHTVPHTMGFNGYGILFRLTPSASEDTDEYPHLTDEETGVKEVGLGQRSHGEVAESEYKC